ncbi:MAG: hypothetical protein WCW54_00825 [Candidatus Paceibacterota bacterium]
MKKNKIILVLALGLLLSPMFAVKAEVATTTNTPPTPEGVKRDPIKDKAKIEELTTKLMKETEIMKNNLTVKKALIEKKITDTKGEIKTKLETKSQEKVKLALESIFNKINVQIGKLSQVDMKISAKIAELEKAGINVTNAKAQYTIAKASLDKTTAEVIATRMIAIDQVGVETSKGVLRDLVKQAEESMKATGKEYMKVIPLISQIKNDKVVEAKKTTSTN